MNAVERSLRQVALDLDRLGARWAVVGGLAVAVRSEPRFTRDVDIAVSVPGDEQAEALVGALLGAGYRTSTVLEQEAANRLATVRLRPPGAEVETAVVDLLFASSGIEPEVVGAAERLELIPGFVLAVARTEHLIALKVLSRDDDRRPQDRFDLLHLLRTATRTEVEDARRLLRLIAERGFGRGRDLEQGLAEMERIAARS